MRISTSKSLAMVLSRKKVQCPHLWFCSRVGGKWVGEQLVNWFGACSYAASAVMRNLCWSVMVKRKLSRKAKFSIYNSIFVPTLTYGHELWVVKERDIRYKQLK